MLTLNVQLDYVLIMGGGQAVQGGLSCPPCPEFQRELIIPKFYNTIYRLSRTVYLAPCPKVQREWIIRNFHYIITSEIFSYKRYKLYFSQSEMLTSNLQLGYVLTRDGELSRAVYLAPHLEFQREWIIRKFYYTIYYRNILLKGI